MVIPNVFWRKAKNKFPQFVLQKANYLSGCGFSFLAKVNYMFLQSIHVFLFVTFFVISHIIGSSCIGFSNKSVTYYTHESKFVILAHWQVGVKSDLENFLTKHIT